MKKTVYGSFLLRYFAWWFDVLLLWFIPLLLFFFVVAFCQSGSQFWFGLLWVIWEIFMLQWMISWLYFILTALHFKASLGKLLAGLQIGREDGKKLKFSDALMRFPVGYTVSGLCLSLGFLWIIKDEKKKGFHDHFANTVVVKKHSSLPLFFALPLLLITYLIIFFLTIQIGINNNLWGYLRSDLSSFGQSVSEIFKKEIPQKSDYYID